MKFPFRIEETLIGPHEEFPALKCLRGVFPDPWHKCGTNSPAWLLVKTMRRGPDLSLDENPPQKSVQHSALAILKTKLCV